MGLVVALGVPGCSQLESDRADAGEVGGRDAAGGDGGSSSAGGRSDSGTDNATGAACSSGGALRCAGSGSPAREVCQDGRWTATEACPEGEVCNGSASAEAGTCSSLLELCMGHAGEPVCLGADMHFCSADSISVRVEDCGSERLCQAGLAAGGCALCLAGAHHCDGAQLRRCAPDGNSYVDVEQCETPELCNESSGACTDAACLAGDKTCSGDQLRQCNSDQSGYEDLEPCGTGLCDEVAGECDVCVPGSRLCNAGNDGYRTCTSDGQGYMDFDCGTNTPNCVGNGTCVECTGPEQCDEPNPCRVAACNAGTCGSTDRPSGACTLGGGGAGVCSSGSCVECTSDDNPCPGDRAYCVDETCRPCDGPCPVGVACTLSGDCASGLCDGTCRPACSGTCAIGAACSDGGDCASGECTDGICSKTCGSVTLASQDDYDAVEDCTTIDGDLIIAWNSPVKDPLFANLTTITGDVGPTYSSGTNSMTGLRLPAVETIGGTVTLTATDVATIDWPELTSIGGDLAVVQALELTRFAAPELTSIGGPVQFTLDPKLTRLDMRALETVDGFFNIIQSPKLDTAYFDAVQTVNGSCSLGDLLFVSYGAVEPLWQASDQSADPGAIGCCVAGTGVTTINCNGITIFSPECSQ
jgi:hypothetical protein